MSYSAIVAKIHTHPHPKADRLQLGTVAGSQVVVGLDVKDGELGVYFPPDGQLSHDFLINNGLYNAAALHELGTPTAQGETIGFFSANRRVRAQNFRGVKSDGFWVPLSYFNYVLCHDQLGPEHVLKLGDQFTELNAAGGVQQICEKYYTPATRRAMANGTMKARKQNAMFPKHNDTMQYRFLSEIPLDAVLYLTEKLHGTSGRFGRVLDEVPPKAWYKRLLNKLTGYQLFDKDREWVYLNGSRNVVLEKTEGAGFYGTNEFRYNVVKGLELHKGEVIFFEIVGYVSDKTPIMATHDTTKLKDKQLEKLYGKTMLYKYGCPEGTHQMYVYKITRSDEDGHAIELSWTQLNQRCQELHLKVVPLLATVSYDWLVGFDGAYAKGVVDKLVESHMEGASTLDPSHLREGVVLRIESAQGISHVKSKSWNFGALEGYIKESDTFVDLEEVS